MTIHKLKLISKNKTMKKQTLFDLTSMPKMILIITLVVMLGTLFGATSYLLKISKTDLPIVNPVIETQCEVDSDCELIYTGHSTCSPCDTSVADYKCFNKDETKKIRDKWDNKVSHVVCKPCQEPQHTCKCSNGKCEKVKIKEVKEVVIATDKMEYEIGEEVKITIENNSNEQKMSYPSYVIEMFENNIWTHIKQIRRPCVMVYEEIGFITIKSGDKLEYEWNQEETECSEPVDQFSSKMISNQVSAGKYRVSSRIFGSRLLDGNIIYSNEFIIKEKSVVDARCVEKSQLLSDCQTFSRKIGYEFDSNIGKCIERFVEGNGCDIICPFESLEECQEVCEESKIDSQDILSDEKVYEILKNFAIKQNVANISDDNILLDAIEFQNGDIKERLKKVEYDLDETGKGLADSIDWRGYVNATTKVCIARSIIYNNLKHTCDLKHDSILSLEDVDDLLATEEIIPYFLVGFTYFKSGDYTKTSYYLDQIILHRQAEIDRWGESYFINASGEIYKKIYEKTTQVLNEIEIAVNG